MNRYSCYGLLTWQFLLTAFVIKHQEIGRICAVKGTVKNFSKLRSRHSPHATCLYSFKNANVIRIHPAVFTITDTQRRYSLLVFQFIVLSYIRLFKPGWIIRHNELYRK